MPEGDTLHKLAHRIRPVVKGRRVAQLSLSHMGEVPEAKGWQVTDVRAQGKHLLLTFDAPWILRTHLGMHGRVSVLRPGSKPSATATFAVTVDSGHTVVCRRAYAAELFRASARATHARLSRLGPDLLADPPDLERAVERASAPAQSERAIAEVLLDQRVAAGIGNVYKSEVLFLNRIDPRTPVGDLSRDRLRDVYTTAATLLAKNLDTRHRTTVPTRRRPYPNSPRLWVYGRTGEPCLECETAIERFTQGDGGRGTWWCPSCQSPSPC